MLTLMQSVPSKSTPRPDLIFPRRRHGIFECGMKVVLGETAWNQSAQLAEKILSWQRMK